MKLTKCENSHFYDSDKYPECPYCNASLQQGNNIVAAAGSQTDADAAQTAQSTGPVTGWLVVMDGKAQGRDLRLGEGRNFIGVDAHGAPVLLSADSPLSTRQAILVYDPATSVFTLLPGTSKELCYLAGEAVLTPQILAMADELTLGGSTLRFMPFCGEFKWALPKAAPAKPAEKLPEKINERSGEKSDEKPAEKSAAKPKNARSSAARTAAAKREADKAKRKSGPKSDAPANSEKPAADKVTETVDAGEEKNTTAAEK